MHTETITWHTPAERMPDIDITVLLRMPENYSEPVWPGFFTGEVWCDEASMVVDEPLAWAEMPAGDPAGAGVPIPSGECLSPSCECEPGTCFQRMPATFHRAAGVKACATCKATDTSGCPVCEADGVLGTGSAAGHTTAEFSNLSTQAHGYGVVVDRHQTFSPAPTDGGNG